MPLTEFEDKDRMRHAELGDMTVTYIKDDGQPAIVHPAEIDLKELGCAACVILRCLDSPTK